MTVQGSFFLQKWIPSPMVQHASRTGRKMKAPSKEMEGLSEDLLNDLPGVEKCRMFGCPCVFVRGNMFAGVVGDRMILRFSQEDRDEFLAPEGAKPFEAMPGKAMREYVEVPESMLSRGPDIGALVKRSYGYASSLPAKPPRPSRKKGGLVEGGF